MESFNLREVIKSSERKTVIEKVTEGLTFEEKEKFTALTETFDVDDENFNKKLEAVKEAYFSPEPSSGLELDEDFEIVFEEKPKRAQISNNAVNLTASYLNRSLKK